MFPMIMFSTLLGFGLNIAGDILATTIRPNFTKLSTDNGVPTTGAKVLVCGISIEPSPDLAGLIGVFFL